MSNKKMKEADKKRCCSISLSIKQVKWLKKFYDEEKSWARKSLSRAIQNMIAEQAGPK